MNIWMKAQETRDLSRSSVRIIGVPEGPKRKSGTDTMSAEMIAEKSPNQKETPSHRLEKR